jgi:hypothetical protein
MDMKKNVLDILGKYETLRDLNTSDETNYRLWGMVVDDIKNLIKINEKIKKDLDDCIKTIKFAKGYYQPNVEIELDDLLERIE